LKQRPVRVSGGQIRAVVNKRPGDVMNLSVTGALIEVGGGALAVGDEATVTLTREGVEVTTTARVIRINPSPRLLRWLVAVMFIDMTVEARRKITQMLRPSTA
jgi:PilZ domain-containing protein